MLQNRKFIKKGKWNICRTPGKIHMYNVVKIDTVLFETIERGF